MRDKNVACHLERGVRMSLKEKSKDCNSHFHSLVMKANKKNKTLRTKMIVSIVPERNWI